MSETNAEMAPPGAELTPIVKQRRGREPSSAGAKVTVACNLPAGLRIRNFRMIPSRELVMGGGSREVNIAEHVGEDIIVHGVAVEMGKAPRCTIVGGYALTPGVDKDAWDAWLADNENSPMVRNKCIFAYERPGKTEDAARDMKGTRSGLEPFKKDGDPRRPRPAAHLTDVVEADERRAEA